MTAELHEKIGEHGAEIASLQRDMTEIKTDLKVIRATLSEARGGWKTVVIIGGVAGAVGAILAKIFPFLPIK
jgi:hypothetical protein